MFRESQKPETLHVEREIPVMGDLMRENAALRARLTVGDPTPPPDPIPAATDTTPKPPAEHNPFRDFAVDRRRIGG